MKCAFCWILAIGLSFIVRLAANEALSPQEAAASLTKEQLLDKWADALGGRENLQNVRTIHLRGTFESGGLKGTYERWTTSSGEFRTSVDLAGAFRQTNVFNRHSAWTLDTSGTVHEVSGDALRRLVGAAYEASDSFLFSGRIPGRVELLSEDSNEGAYVLRLEPEGGIEVTVHLDAKTFLPKREESSGPMGKRVISFSDWREFGGIRIPGTVHQSTGDPRFNAVVTTEQVEINAVLTPELFEKPDTTAEGIHFANGAHEAVLPAEVYGDHIFVPVRVNGGEAGWFFLDSGAGMSVVSKSWAENAGLVFVGEVRGQGSGAGSASMGLAKNVELSLGEAQVPKGTLAVWDFSSILPILGRQWDGLLGYDVVSRLVVRADYEHKRITLYDPATFVPGDQATALAVTFLGNLPIVRAKIALPGREPVDVECAIDSGADGFHLTTPFTNANHVLESVQKRISTSSVGAGGGSREFAGRIAGLQLGPYFLREPVTAFSPDLEEGLLASRDIGALVGGRILKRFTVTFDYAHHRILLEPNSHFSDPFRANESGLFLLAKGADFHVFQVDEVERGSPAEFAGVEKGDVLTAIDSHSASELDLARIDEILQQLGRTIPIVVERNGRALKLTLKLTKRI